MERRHADLRHERLKALEDFLSTEGVKNIEAVNHAIGSAKSWKPKPALPPPESSHILNAHFAYVKNHY